MGVKAMLVAMVVGTPAVMVLGHRKSEPAKRIVHHKVAEAPWLSREAAAQIVGIDGQLGPLFDGLLLGGPPPAPEVREQIAAFARANNVKIDLDVTDDQLVAIRFAVTYPGGFGYEGADVLASRLLRPSTGVCCVCGEDTWINSWSLQAGSIDVRVRVRVNTVEVRWRPMISLTQLLARADEAFGERVDTLSHAAGEDWVVDTGLWHLIREPFPFSRNERPFVSYRNNEGGLELFADDDKVTQVSFFVPAPADGEDAKSDPTRATLEAHWGRPHRKKDMSTWRLRDRIIEAERSDYGTQIDIKAR